MPSETKQDVYAVLRDRIATREAIVGVVGLGYVGLPLAVEHARAGFSVVGLDDNSAKVDKVRSGQNYIPDVDDRMLQDLVREGRLTATSDYRDLTAADVIIICVPTPLTDNKEPDLSYIIQVANRIRTIMRPGQLIVLESTTYPGTTEEVLEPILETSGLTLGTDFFLAS